MAGGALEWNGNTERDALLPHRRVQIVPGSLYAEVYYCHSPSCAMLSLLYAWLVGSDEVGA